MRLSHKKKLRHKHQKPKFLVIVNTWIGDPVKRKFVSAYLAKSYAITTSKDMGEDGKSELWKYDNIGQRYHVETYMNDDIWIPF